MNTRTVQLDQLLSFVTHDVYAPASMLRTYLQAVHASATADDAVRDMVADAETLARELEVMLRLLQDRLRLATGRIKAAEDALDLAAFLRAWAERHAEVHWREAAPPADPVLALANGPVLARVLDDAGFQLQRMGSRRGEVTLALEVRSSRVSIHLCRDDGGLDADVLEAALLAPDEEWFTRLRYLPASGLPLRIAAALVEALGGKCRIEGESKGGASLVLDFARIPNKSGPKG